MIFIRIARGLTGLASGAAALALVGCGATPPPVIGQVVARPSDADGQAGFEPVEAAGYRLRASDVVSVRVYREPDLSLTDVPIGSDGMIAIPLAGQVRAEGRTTVELAEAIVSALRRGFVNDPQVSVNVTKYESHRVTVEGAVKKPGVFLFMPGSRLSAAIAMAEGPDRVAKLDQVAVFRPNEQGVMVAKFDYRAMQQGTMLDPVLQPGDRVVVGTSGLSQFWQDVLKTLPAFALFTQF